MIGIYYSEMKFTRDLSVNELHFQNWQKNLNQWPACLPFIISKGSCYAKVMGYTVSQAGHWQASNTGNIRLGMR